MRGQQDATTQGVRSVGSTASEVSVVRKKAEWSVCHTPLRKPQHRPLGFWRKATPSAAELHAFEKQHLMGH